MNVKQIKKRIKNLNKHLSSMPEDTFDSAIGDNVKDEINMLTCFANELAEKKQAKKNNRKINWQDRNTVPCF